MKNRGIYIHIPFCKKKCDYCDFTSYKYNRDEVKEYIRLLCKEIGMYSDCLKNTKVTSIYFGGGTPSVLECDDIQEVLEALKPYYDMDIEITFEVNPESATKEKLECVKNLGINRVSIGVQSLEDKGLKFLGRIHDSTQALQAIKNISEMRFNYSVDFIYGFDKTRNIKTELEQILKFNPNHISLYPLEIYDGLKISEKIKEIDDAFALDEYRMISKYLKEKGFTHYEVSNFALSGYESVHNSNYWKCIEYFGFGVSSHGYLNNIRYENERTLVAYKKKVLRNEKPIASEEQLSEQDQRAEFIMLGMRLSDGISIKAYEKRFNTTFDKLNEQSVLRHIENGLLILEDGYLKLSEEGNYQMNNILVDLL